MADPEFHPWLLGQGDRREARRGRLRAGIGKRQSKEAVSAKLRVERMWLVGGMAKSYLRP